jgi:hypothetical protein
MTVTAVLASLGQEPDLRKPDPFRRARKVYLRDGRCRCGIMSGAPAPGHAVSVAIKNRTYLATDEPSAGAAVSGQTQGWDPGARYQGVA